MHTAQADRFGGRRSICGFSLIEVVIALSITVFAILSILGLLGGALHVNRESEQRIEAANLATTLIAQYREALNYKASGSGGFPENFPIPDTSLGTSAATSFSTPPVPISAQGARVASLKDRNAAYALSYIVWKNPPIGGGATSPYDVVNCSLRFQWPPQGAGNTSNKQVDSFEVTTSFLVKN